MVHMIWTDTSNLKSIILLDRLVKMITNLVNILCVVIFPSNKSTLTKSRRIFPRMTFPGKVSDRLLAS